MLTVNASAYGNGLDIKGGEGADTITGSAFNDTLVGGYGGDTIVGGAGNDIIYADNQVYNSQYSPSDISGMTLWLDASDVNADGTSVSGDITTWYDKSGSGNNATAVSAATYVENSGFAGQSALSFDRTQGDYYTLPDGTIPTGNSSYAIFAVVQADTLGSYGIVGSGSYGTNSGVNALRIDANGYLQNYWWNNDVNTAVGSVSTDTNYIMTALYDNTSGRTISVNDLVFGTSSTTNLNNGSANNTIGKSYNTEYWNGDIAEIIVYQGVLSDAEAEEITRYLAYKYSINASGTMLGIDTLTGGLGSDTFVWNDSSASTTSATDIITDFNQSGGSYNNAEGDVIRFEYDQALTLTTGNAFTGIAGEVIWHDDGAGGVYVDIDFSGDSAADFRVQLQDVNGDFDQTDLSAANFEFHSVNLTSANDTLNGIDGSNDTFYTTLANYNAGDAIDGGTGTDTLQLQGGGTFTLTNNITNFESVVLSDGASYNVNLTSITGITSLDGSNLTGSNALTADASVYGSGLSITGGEGDDSLLGSAFADTLIGGAGNDTLFYDSADLVASGAVDGGTGTDSLSISGSGISLDLTSVDDSFIQNIERIDLTGSGDNSVTLNESDVLATSSTVDYLYIEGNTGDTATLSGGGWASSGASNGPEGLAGQNYTLYVSNSAQVYVDTDIVVTLA